MNLPAEIKTIDEFKESIFKEKKSTFIAQVYSVSSEKEADEYLSKARKKYYDASHHCYAYKIADGTIRHTDAGEPAGTAGLRILNAIEHFNLTNQLVTVIRYFGGVKLGVGSLGKAYYNSSEQVLKESKVKTKQLFQKVIISSSFDQISIVHRVLSRHQSFILSTENQKEAKFSCLLKAQETNLIFEKLRESSKNKISPLPSMEFIYK